MAPPKPAYDVDWILSNNPNVHVTNHRDWFTSYMPFTTFVNPCLSDAADASKGMKVLGIGDVALPTNIHSTQTGPANQRTILLRNVLHAPAFFCNIVGFPLGDNHEYSIGDSIADGISGGKIYTKTTRVCVALLEPVNGLLRLRIRGPICQPNGP